MLVAADGVNVEGGGWGKESPDPQCSFDKLQQGEGLQTKYIQITSGAPGVQFSQVYINCTCYGVVKNNIPLIM